MMGSSSGGLEMTEIELLSIIDLLKRRKQELYAEIAQLRLRLDVTEARLWALLPKATPEEEEELKQLMETASPFDLSALIAELEVKCGPATHVDVVSQ
jgi:hypothetical protein